MLRRFRWVPVSLLLASICGLSVPARAVEVVAGMKAGFTMSDMMGNDLANPTAMNNLAIGAILGWEINEWFAVQVQPLWTQKGAEVQKYQFGDLPATMNLEYLELPVLAKFKRATGEERRSCFSGVLGPALG